MNPTKRRKVVVWGITLTVGIIVVLSFMKMNSGDVIALVILFSLLLILALPIILVIKKWNRSGCYKKFAMAIFAVCDALIIYALVSYITPEIRGPTRGSPKSRSENTAVTISGATTQYIFETGKIPPLNSHLSEVLMGKNQLNIKFIEGPSKNPIGTLINKEGYFIDAYGHPYSVQIKDNKIIVMNSDGEVLATRQIYKR